MEYSPHGGTEQRADKVELYDSRIMETFLIVTKDPRVNGSEKIMISVFLIITKCNRNTDDLEDLAFAFCLSLKNFRQIHFFLAGGAPKQHCHQLLMYFLHNRSPRK